VFEEPLSHALWLCKATPREWLDEGEVIALERAPTAYGRLGLRVTSHIRSTKRVHVNLSLPAAWWADGPHKRTPPAGGLRLRLRPPGDAHVIRAAIVGGVEWTRFNASDATLAFDAAGLADVAMQRRLTDIWVMF
jgi:hypothetical protein